MSAPVHFDTGSLVRFDTKGPFIRALGESGHARVLLVCLAGGQVLRDHKSASQVIACFLQGRGIFVVDGTPAAASRGAVFMVEPGRFHRIHAEEDTVVLITMTPHPARDRYPRDQVDRIVIEGSHEPQP